MRANLEVLVGQKGNCREPNRQTVTVDIKGNFLDEEKILLAMAEAISVELKTSVRISGAYKAVISPK